MQEIYGEGSTRSKTTGQCEIEESDMESLIMQEMCGCIFRECIKDATGHELKYLTEKLESRVSLTRELVLEEKEKKLRSQVLVGNDSLKQEVAAHLDGTLMEEEEKLATEVLSATLMKKIEQFDLASQELTEELRDHVNRQQQVISNTCKDLDLVKGLLKEALEQIQVNEMEINRLNKHLELQMHMLEEADEEKKTVVARSQATQNDLSLLEAKEKKQRKQMQAVVPLAHALSEQFTQLERKVTEDINANNSRLIDSTSQLSSLIEKAEMLTNVGLQYKQRLERRRCSELKMAEAESLIRSIQEELLEQNAMFCGSQSVNLLEMFNEISNLRKELAVILKLLPNHETGQLVSLGFGDVDHSHRKVLNNHIPSSNPHWEGNGRLGDPETGVPEVFDAAHIKHLSRDELVKHFNTKMRDYKRDHESTVQQMVEENISLKGKILSERGSSLPSRKDKEFDILRKKIPEVIQKLDGIIVDNEKLPALCYSTLVSLKNRLGSLLLENHQLRDLLTDKKNKVKCLSSQVSEAEEKMLQHSSLEATSIEASVREEVYKCVLRELTDRIKSESEESEMKSIIMQEIIYGEGSTRSKTTGQCEIEESDMESLIMQEMCGCIFRECVKDASQELTEELRDHTNRQRQVISNTCKDLDLVKGELKEALEQIEVNEMKINFLNEHLQLQMHMLEEAGEEKKRIVAHSQATQNDLSLLEAKEKEQRKQMQAVVPLAHALSEQFTQLERKVTEDINANNSRFIDSTSQLSSLIEKAEMLTNMGLQYKQRLERRCSDLEMAEAEVDLLGDQVETLSSLLEKIYLALDHYSPILQHYPGIIEIMKLVRRGVSGETSKSV